MRLYDKSKPPISLLGSSTNPGVTPGKVQSSGCTAYTVSPSSEAQSILFHHPTLSTPSKNRSVSETGKAVRLGLKFEIRFFSKTWLCFRPKPLTSYKRWGHSRKLNAHWDEAGHLCKVIHWLLKIRQWLFWEVRKDTELECWDKKKIPFLQLLYNLNICTIILVN